MKKDICPYCGKELSFRAKIAIDPRYSKKCPFCNKKIGMPYWTNFQYLIVVTIIFLTFKSWFFEHKIMGIILFSIVTIINGILTTLFIPVVERD